MFISKHKVVNRLHAIGLFYEGHSRSELGLSRDNFPPTQSRSFLRRSSQPITWLNWYWKQNS